MFFTTKELLPPDVFLAISTPIQPITKV